MGDESEDEANRVIDVEDYYRRFGPMVGRRCLQMLSNEAEAMDAAQDVFVKLVRNADRLEDRAPSSLLYQMATNVCLNRLRSQRRRPEDPRSDMIHRIAASFGGDRADGRIYLRQLMHRQPEKTRLIATLRWVDQMTLEEVADEVGMSVSGVRKRLRKMRAELNLVDQEAEDV